MPHAFDRYVVMPFSDELHELPRTYQDAMALDVTDFADWLHSIRDRPLLSVGAGGSLAIAEIAAQLHEHATGQLARTAEPMDVYLAARPFTSVALLQVTAGGSHGDALAIGRHLTALSTAPGVFCGSLGTVLEEELTPAVPVFAFPLLPNVHGWVAVNVLLGQAIVLARAYQLAFPEVFSPLPDCLDHFLNHGDDVDANVAHWTHTLAPVFARPSLVCLHGSRSRVFAVDLDSKFAESGLGELSLSEYRNFAHGRYQSVLERQDEIGILQISTPPESPIARAIEESIPAWMPHAAIHIDEEDAAASAVAQIVHLLLVVAALGECRGLVVGWGSRNTFGDPLYEEIPVMHHRPSNQLIQ